MNTKNIKRTIIILTSIALSFTVIAEDRVELEAMSIIGNKELPKMLYIVPWKNSELPDMNTPPLESLIDEALSPVDRDNFRRKIRYYQIYSSNKSEE